MSPSSGGSSLSSSMVSELNGTTGGGAGGGILRNMTFLISTRSLAMRLSSVGVSEIFSTMSMPSATKANGVNCPLNCNWSETQMKNCEPCAVRSLEE